MTYDKFFKKHRLPTSDEELDTIICQEVKTSYILSTPKCIQESIATQIKRLVQHTQAVQAFMICKTGSCNVLVRCQGATIHTISYKHKSL